MKKCFIMSIFVASLNAMHESTTPDTSIMDMDIDIDELASRLESSAIVDSKPKTPTTQAWRQKHRLLKPLADIEDLEKRTDRRIARLADIKTGIKKENVFKKSTKPRKPIVIEYEEGNENKTKKI